MNAQKFSVNPDQVLTVRNLNISFLAHNTKQYIHIIRGVDLDIPRGKIVGLVGESGSGKTVTSKAFLGVNDNAISSADLAQLSDVNLLNFKKNKDWLSIRGKKIGYIPQDPLTALNPTRTVGKQLLDCLKNDPRFKTTDEKINYLVGLLETFGIHDARKGLNAYPDTFSGGMRQRVVIAMVVALNPELIIADEPTTALDPTIQASVLSLLDTIRKKYKIAIIFISHNISVVAKFCDYIYVMYAGKVVERGTRKDIFTNALHPYTWALINSIPENKEERLYTIKGTPPDMLNLPAGDPFAQRNEYALELDFVKEPPLIQVSQTHAAATWLLHPDAPKIELNSNLKARLESFRKVFNES
ncbi:ABC transporter ATP-binding protein [Mycoplasmoides fastidiosum]|nr:ABC transporter ATP-binding protein [Mycoplasmoides fastidiosum]